MPDAATPPSHAMPMPDICRHRVFATLPLPLRDAIHDERSPPRMAPYADAIDYVLLRR